MEKDIYLVAEGCLTDGERARFINFFMRMNPRMRGAHVADILAEADNADAHLDIIEPMADDHILDWDRAHNVACYCVLYMQAGLPPSWDDVHALALKISEAMDE